MREPKGDAGLIQAWLRRPLSLATFGLALGLALGRAWPVELWTPALVLGLVLAVAVAGQSLGPGLEKRLGLALLLLGLSAGSWRVQPLMRALQAVPLPAQAGLRLEGRLAWDEGARALGRHVWTLNAASLQNLQGEPIRGPLRLRLSVDEKGTQDWKPGDRVRVYGTFRVPARPANPGEFDYRSYLLGRGLAGSFSARKGWPQVKLETGPSWGLHRLAWRLRRHMQTGLEAGLSPRASALARGIVLGDRSAMEPGDQAEFAKAGFADILAVSGTHFTLALGLFLLLAKLLRLGRRSQAALGLGLGLAYALLTGFEAPIQRAFALFTVWLLARLLDLECEALLSLAVGALIILLFQPGALWEPGFQLSFFCTWAVLALSRPLASLLPAWIPAKIRLVLGGVSAAQVALIPLLAFHFHQLCWPGLLSCWVTGFFTLAILGLGLPLGVLGAFWPAAALVLGWPLEQVLRWLDLGAEALSALPYAAFSTGQPSTWVFLAWALGPLAFFVRSPRWFKPGFLLLLPLLLLGLLWPGLPGQHRHAGLTRFWMLDVGQGDGLLLEFGDGRCLLVDGGPPRPDAGSRVVVPALRALGIQRLNWVVATHADADHVGGLAWVLAQFPVGELLYNGKPSTNKAWKAVLRSAKAKGLEPRILQRGQARQPGDGPWRVLHPSPPKTRRRPAKRPVANDHSVVLQVEDWLLLTGDMPKKVEKKLLKEGLLRPVAVLKVGHHGSRTSTSPAFVKRLKPSEALLSCGAGNSFGHPQALVLDALKGARLWRTDLQGCVVLEHRPDGSLSFKPWRQASTPALAQGAVRQPSPWRRLKKDQEKAWEDAEEEEDP